MPMLFVQERPEDNLYARPLEGIRMKLDLWATPPAVVAFLDAQVTLTLALALTLTPTLTLTLTLALTLALTLTLTLTRY